MNETCRTCIRWLRIRGDIGYCTAPLPPWASGNDKTKSTDESCDCYEYNAIADEYDGPDNAKDDV